MVKKLKVRLLPNIITAFGLSCGLFVIFKMNMTEVGGADLHVLTATAGILLLAALADLLDGAVARVMKAESDFGGLFDSLSDAITFGVTPSVIILKTLSISPGTDFSFFLTMAAMVYTLCGVLRLVRFNIIAQMSKTDPELLLAAKKNFTGLPIPAAAAAAVSANLFLVSDQFKNWFHLGDQERAWIMFGIMITLGFFMISRWKFPSLKRLKVRVASFSVVVFTVLMAVCILFGILHYFPVTFFALSWGYVLLAWILSIIRVVSGRKSKTLEDFEPEPEEDLIEEPEEH